MVDLPDILRIGYQHVRVTHDKFNGFNGDHGAYKDDTAEIHLNSDKPDREKVNTVIHEILHAIIYTYAMRQSIFSDKDREELAVTTLANALTQVLLDNPLLLEWIREILHGK